jgi:hypothetical protein
MPITENNPFSQEELGMSKYPPKKEGMKVVPPAAEPKCMKIAPLDGVTKASSKYMKASKPWKPKGRK